MSGMQKQVTVGFKVSGGQKKEIEAVARRLGVDVSTYLREMLMDRHNRARRFISIPDALVVELAHVEPIVKRLEKLRNKYPSYSGSEILNASLSVALENESRIVSNKIKNHLK